MHKRIALVSIIVIALAASLAFVVGCSNSSGSSKAATKTLETFVNDNKADWDKTVKQLKDSGGDILDVEVTVEGNTINQIMTYKNQFTDEQVAVVKKNLDEQSSSMISQISSQIKDMEKAAGVTGITWYFEYRNGDGKTIASYQATAK